MRDDVATSPAVWWQLWQNCAGLWQSLQFASRAYAELGCRVTKFCGW
jgi:hypothetical protein